MNNHMRSLSNLGKVNDDNNTKKIRHLYDQIECHLRSLKALGVQPDGQLLVPMLLGKLPSRLNLHISRKFDSQTDVWKIDELLLEIRKELEARERCFVEEKPDKPPPKKNDTSTIEALITQLKAEGFAIDRQHIETLLTGAERPSQSICPFCEGNHYPDQCQSITDIATRKNMLGILT